MNKEFKINSFNELIQFIEDENLNSSEICILLAGSMAIFADENKPPTILIQELKEYWKQFKNLAEKPLFLD